jgi:hypothetical protein
MFNAGKSIYKAITGEGKTSDAIKAALAFTANIDPTGLSDIISAFIHPSCLSYKQLGLTDEESNWELFKFYDQKLD